MALYDGTEPGRTGPYWRRQQHRTLPGERTAAELAAENALRRKMGLPPLGGPTQHAAVPAGGVPSRPSTPVSGFPGWPVAVPPAAGYPRGGGFSQIPENIIPGIGGAAGAGAQINRGAVPGAPHDPRFEQPLGSLPLPQLLALRGLFAKLAQHQRPVQPAQRSILPQLHQAVPVRPHVRMVGPRRASIY